MKPTLSRPVVLLLVFLIFPFALLAAQPSESGTARVVKAEGSVFLLDVDAGNRVRLRAGDNVAPGSSFVTEEKSRLVLLFSNGTVMALGPNTAMSIEEYLHENPGGKKANPNPSSMELFLEYGEAFGNTEKLDTTSEFTVRAPLGTAGIRGTTFGAFFDPADVSLVVSNVHGEVDWSHEEDSIEIPNGRKLTVTGLIGEDGSVEILDTHLSDLDRAETREIVQALLEGISARFGGLPLDERLLPGPPPYDHDIRVLSPSR